MSLDPAQMKQRFIQMTIANVILMLVALGFAIAHFSYGVGWALYGFIGFIGLAFAVQMWFVRGVARDNKRN
jgi:multidrug transporter EmrE-like cation transporter